MIVQKADLVNNYDYKQVKEAESKERTKWMYIVLVGCWLFQMLPYCVALNLGGVFAQSDWAVWSQNDGFLLNMTFTMGAIGAAIFGPAIAATFGKKINLRVIYIFGIALAMAGFMLLAVNSALFNIDHTNYNLAASVALLWVPTIIIQIGVMVFSGLGVNYLISLWWPAEKRGTALGFAFTGGSLGNMWMQPLCARLAGIFGNKTLDGKEIAAGDPGYIYHPEENVYTSQGDGQQWATYIILGCAALVISSIVALVICRKPIPQVDILNAKAQDEKQQKQVAAQTASNQITDVNLLQTKGYAPYWILAIGLTFVLMATSHANLYGQVLGNRAKAANKIENVSINATDILGKEGIVFGACCLIGNFFGGMLNDKIGPVKSISLGGLGQCAALVCLLFSIDIPNLIFGYAVFAGLSVYTYTSTPAFLCGKLYGAKESTNHMAIYGLFLALGFAIVNAVNGPIIGNQDASNVHEFMGKHIYGNYPAVIYFLLACMVVGIIITVSCCYIIGKKGIKGISEYSASKYSNIIYFKHNKAINFSANRILRSGKDFRNNSVREEKIAAKKAASKYQGVHNEYIEAIGSNFASAKFTDSQKKLLGDVFYYGVIDAPSLQGESKVAKDFDKEIKTLLDKKYIEEMNLGQVKAYKLSSETLEKLTSVQNEIAQKRGNAILKANNAIIAKMDKLSNKTEMKLAKANAKLEAAKAGVEAANANTAVIEANKTKSNTLIEKWTNARKIKLEAASHSSAWVQYQIDYNYADRILEAKALATKIQDAAQAKVVAAQKKIGVAQYMGGYNKLQAIKANKLLVDYYNDIYGTYDQLISKCVNDTLDRQALIANTNIARATVVLNKKMTHPTVGHLATAHKKERIIAKNQLKVQDIEDARKAITAQFAK